MKIKQGGIVSQLLAGVSIPKMFYAEQKFPRERINPEDIPAKIFSELSREPFVSKIKSGMQIAITAGSRGIANVAIITRSIADFVKSRNAIPFIVPAMGSHGGATAEGQLEVLEGYGITPESMGCEIRSSMEVVELGISDSGQHVYIDRNAYDETCRLEAIDAPDILKREPELLKLGFTFMPSLLVGECDVLIVDETGKNYSGTGVDPNITGTFSTEYASGGVKVQRTCFLDLSDESHGNSLGVGLANVITKKFFDKIDTEKMYPNCITSTVLNSARIPCVVSTDKEAIQLCIRTCTGIDHDRVRIIRIPNSLHIGKIMLSEAYYDDVLAGKWKGLSALSEPQVLSFDEHGNLMHK